MIRWLALLIVILVVAAPAHAASPRLEPFDSCAELIRSVRGAKARIAQARPRVDAAFDGNSATAVVDGGTLYRKVGRELQVIDIASDAPRELARVKVPGASGDGYDGFVLAAKRLLVLADTGGSYTNHRLRIHSLTRATPLAEVTTIRPPVEDELEPLIVGDRLLTFTYWGLQAHRLADFAKLGELKLP